jgi:rhodanese-related sulfurtransferase
MSTPATPQHKQHNPGFLALVNDAKTRVREIDVLQLKRMCETGERFLLIDVREESEFAAGHPAGALHLGKGIIERDIETVAADKSACLVLCCGGGFRSALAGDNLLKMGYTNVISLAGGWRDYLSSGMPVER